MMLQYIKSFFQLVFEEYTLTYIYDFESLRALFFGEAITFY